MNRFAGINSQFITMVNNSKKQIWNRWGQLPRTWKTPQAYQIINMLKANRIYVRTLPDEFSGAIGKQRMMNLDSETMWPIFVKARQAELAIMILSKENLY